MTGCAVLSCKSDSRNKNKKDNDISFHRLPKNEELAQQWLEAIKRPNLSLKQIYICSKHFNYTLMTKKGLRKLAPDAIPELHLKDDDDDSEKKPAKNVDEEFASDLNLSPRVKERIRHLQLIIKRRKMRANALSSQVHRLNKQIENLSEIVKAASKNMALLGTRPRVEAVYVNE